MGIYAELAGTAQAPGEARRLIGLVLDEDHPCADDTALIISELVSNAVAHTRAGQLGGTVLIGVEVTGVPPAMRITVRDPGADGIPVVTDPDPEQEHGRGLHMIAALATEWGSETSAVGRATWCRLMGDATSAARDSDRLTLAAWARRQGQHVRWCVPADEPKCTLAHLAVLGRPGAAPSGRRGARRRGIGACCGSGPAPASRERPSACQHRSAPRSPPPWPCSCRPGGYAGVTGVASADTVGTSQIGCRLAWQQAVCEIGVG